MVAVSLAIGGGVGVLLSGGFIWWEVGRFATPQVPVTLFDERKLLAAYTVGLFVGVPLAATYLLLAVALANGALIGGLGFLLALVGGGELAQSLALRTHYWSGASRPFYALGLRAGIGGILALTVVTLYLGSPPVGLVGLAPAALGTLAVMALEVTGALVSLPPPGAAPRVRGRPLSGLLFGAVGFLLLALGPLAGLGGAIAGGSLALVGAALVYRRLRPLLEEVPPPGAAPLPSRETEPAYGRTAPPPSPREAEEAPRR